MRSLLRLLAIVAIFPAPAFSQALDSQLTCSETAHDFVTGLVEDQSIETPAMRVEPNSVNAFRPAGTKGLTAFGMHVQAVFGYQPDDPLFKPGEGKPPSDPIYGVVVRASADAVKRRLSEAGSTAAVHSVVPLVLTAIVCTQGPGEISEH
jgi:hypothetical protein